jgi:hypothetical protein
MGSILVFLAQANPSNRRPLAVCKKQRLEKQAAALPQRRVVPLVRK